MLAQGEVIVDSRHAFYSGQAFEHFPFAPQPFDRVGAVGREASVRPGLFQDHPHSGALVSRLVESPAVGEMQDLLDAIRQFGDGGGVARCKLGYKQVRQGDPRRRAEHRIPAVRHQRSVGTLDGRHPVTPRRQAVPQCEPAIAHVEWTFVPAQVAEDVGTWFAGQ